MRKETTLSKPVYHVRHDLQPELTLELLLLLEAKSPCRAADLGQFAQTRGYRLATRSIDQLLSSLSNLRIVARNTLTELTVTPRGQLMAAYTRQSPELLAELLHFTYYTLYDLASEPTPSLRFSWAYRQVCDFLWDQGNQQVKPDQLVTLVQERAQITFGDVEEYGVSFSRDSVTGILQWLEALDPSCLRFNAEEKRIFARRSVCPLDTLLLALQYLAHVPTLPPALQLQLTAPVRQAVSRLCLIDPESLDDLLPDLAQSLGLVYRQTERGQWLSLLGERSPLPLTIWQDN
jgi:hypothetical protein